MPLPTILSSEVREVMWVSPDQATAEGRWFWGEYQEFGFDVKMQRASADPTLIGVDRTALKTGSRRRALRLISAKLAGASCTPSDLDFGTGVTVKRIVSHTPMEIVAEVDVATGRRSWQARYRLPALRAAKRDCGLRPHRLH